MQNFLYSYISMWTLIYVTLAKLCTIRNMLIEVVSKFFMMFTEEKFFHIFFWQYILPIWIYKHIFNKKLSPGRVALFLSYFPHFICNIFHIFFLTKLFYRKHKKNKMKVNGTRINVDGISFYFLWLTFFIRYCSFIDFFSSFILWQTTEVVIFNKKDVKWKINDSRMECLLCVKRKGNKWIPYAFTSNCLSLCIFLMKI